MNKLFFFTLLCLTAFHTSKAQQNPEWSSVFSRINNEVQRNSRAYSTLKDASEKIGHRLTGSTNGKMAEQYAYDLLKSYGFDVKYQPFEVESWSRGNIETRIGKPSNLAAIKSVSLAHSPVKADLTGNLVDMGNGLESDYIGQPEIVKGKIALV